MSKWEELSIPVNPKYDWNGPPDQGAFFNPVTLCNKEVQYANAIIEIAGQLIEINKQLGAVKLRLKAAKQHKDDIESDIIAEDPPTREESKNLMLLASYVRVRATIDETYVLAVEAIKEMEEELSVLEIKKENAFNSLDTLKMVSQNLQTALSYYKAEMKTFVR